MKTYDDFKIWLEKRNFQKTINKLARKYKDKKVVLYGAGLLTSVILDNYDVSALNIIAVADLKFVEKQDNGDFKSYKTISSFEIPDYKPDMILLCTYYQNNTLDFIKKNIFPKLDNAVCEPIIKKGITEAIDENNFFSNFILDALKKLPFTSEIIGPPKCYLNTKDWIEKTGKGQFIEIYPESKALKNPDRIYQAAYVSEIQNARVYSQRGTVITPDDKVLIDVSTDCKPVNEHTVFKQVKLPRVKYFKGKAAVISMVANHNYYHWMMDILPRLELIEKSGLTPDKIIAPNNLTYQKQSFNLLGIPDEKLIFNDEKFHLKVENLIVPSLTGGCADWACNFLRTKFLPYVDHKKSYPEYIYVSRRNVIQRKVLNEDAVISYLNGKGFEEVRMETLDLVDQISLFARAKVIVAPHGAGLTNLVFCNPNTTVLEICSPNLVLNYFKDICDQVGLNHTFILGKGEDFTSTNVDFFRQNIMVDIDALDKHLTGITC